jgi:hypothetical protein
MFITTSHSENNQGHFSPLSEKYLYQTRELPDDGAFMPLDIPNLSEPKELPPVQKKKWEPSQARQRHFAFKKGLDDKWHTYNIKVAEALGEEEAIFLEDVRTWANHNAEKRNKTLDHYQMEKAGIDLAQKFGWSERTHYRKIKHLKNLGYLKIEKSSETKSNPLRRQRMNQYSPDKTYFEIAGQEIMTPLEKKLFLGEEMCQTPPLDPSQKQGETPPVLPNLAETLCHENSQSIEKQGEITTPPYIKIHQNLSSLLMVSKETANEEKALDPNLTVEATERVKECVIQKNDRKIESSSSSQAVETKSKQHEMAVFQPKPVTTPPKKAGCTTTSQTQMLEKDFEEFHGFHPSRLREKHLEFLRVYPKKIDHDASFTRFAQTLFLGEIAFEELIKRVKRFACSEEVKKRIGIEGGRYIKNASSWLRDKFWEAPAIASSAYDAPNPEEKHRMVQDFISHQTLDVRPFLTLLHDKVGDGKFMDWFAKASYSLEEKILKIEVETPFTQDWIKRHFAGDLDMASHSVGLMGYEMIPRRIMNQCISGMAKN